jgi:hypothetical protein
MRFGGDVDVGLRDVGRAENALDGLLPLAGARRRRREHGRRRASHDERAGGHGEASGNNSRPPA